MKLDKKKVTNYGNSKIINVPDLDKGQEVYILDEEMLRFLTNTDKK